MGGLLADVQGFDARRNSREFAQLAAAVFRSRGVRVWLFPEPVPTPHVAAALVAQACAAGVMITASHNPKDYNGYKVYWSNGCQIIPPHDAGISSCILNSLALWPLHASDAALAPPLVRDPSQPVAAMYSNALAKLQFRSAAANAASAPVVYTPLHGVGWPAVRSAFSQFALPQPIPVPEQKLPDENFPTVQFPNPEEGAGVWQLSISTAEEHGAMLLLANDPDADRMAAMEAADGDADGWADAAAPREERWRAFTGNEIGVLLAHWLWTNHVRKLPAGSAGKVAMLSSVVSSHMLAAMAAHEGFRHEETLTGFKWLGNRACDLELEGYTVLFAFEEAIGYMPLPSIKDKDGIAAAVVFAEMAASLYASGTTVARHLRALQDAYGHFQYRSGYLVASRPGASRAAFDRLRAGGKYREAVGGYPVASVRDLGMGLDTSQPNRKPDLPWSESDMMITFTLAAPAEGAWITLRASGTEPKLKYYLEVCGADAKQSAQLADALEAAVAADLLHPGGSTGLEWPGSDS